MNNILGHIWPCFQHKVTQRSNNEKMFPIYRNRTIIIFTFCFDSLNNLYFLTDPSSFNFDVIFVEVFFFDCLLGFAHHFKAPVIAMVSQFSLPWAYDIVGNPHSYSHSPSIFLPYGENMTFFERLRNTLFILGVSLARR